mgnify:FL=1
MDAHDKALQDLEFIRDTMARSAVTNVSGYGLIGMGVTALIGAYVAALGGTVWWTNTWTVVAVVGCSVGFWSMWYKARKAGASIFTSSGRRFAFALAPPIAAGTILSQYFFMNSQMEFLPSTWLLLYGTGVVTGGAYSIRLIPIMGIVFMCLGTIVLYAPATMAQNVWGAMTWYDVLLALGFGGIHIVFGAIIATRYGG